MGRPGVRSSVVLALPVLCAVKMLAGLGMTAQAGITQPVSEVMRLPTGWQLNRGPMGSMRTELAVAPDGTSIVFSATPDGTMPKARLYRRLLDRTAAAVIPGTPEGVCMPIFSPDGRWIAYWAAEKLFKVPVEGGTPAPICELKARPFGMSWALDGRIIFGTQAAGLFYVPPDGGTPQTLTTIDRTRERTHRLPHVVAGGKGLLFTTMPCDRCTVTRLEWLSLENSGRKLLVEDASDGRYVASGHLVFVRRGALMAIPFDPVRVQTGGRAVAVVARLMHAFNTIMPDMNSGAGQYGVSDSGALVWASGGMVPDVQATMYWIDRSGHAEPWTAFGTRSVYTFRLSPDGQRVAFTDIGSDRSIFVYDIRRNRTTRLTSNGWSWFLGPCWTPDGNRIAFEGEANGFNMWWATADGAAKPARLVRSDLEQRASSWSRDGRYLAFVEGENVAAGLDIKVLRMADRQVTAFAATKASEMFPEFSPDGRWLAYVSNETGRNEVYVRSFPDGKRTVQISTEGATSPLWGPGGRELFYFDIAFKKLTKVDISAGETVSVGAARLVFEFPSLATQMIRSYDITPDGQRFLVQKAVTRSPDAVTELNLERRWFDRLKRVSLPTN